MDTVNKFLTKMYRTNPDFLFTVTRDFVRSCQTPVLILPDDIPAHPYAVAMEAAMLAPKAQVSITSTWLPVFRPAQESRCTVSGENAGRQTAMYSAPSASGLL